MNDDQKLIAEAYKRIYLEADADFRDQMPTSAKVHEPEVERREAQAEVNQGEGLKKYTYEILYPIRVKDPNKKNELVQTGYGTHSSGRPDLRHVFANSKEEALEKLSDSGLSTKNLKERIAIRKEEPADMKEVEAERRHNQTMSNYYGNASKTGAYTGD